MRRKLHFRLFIIVSFIILLNKANAQQCNTGGCTNGFPKEYPTVGAPYTAPSSWQVLNNPATGNAALMNGGNWTRFNVVAGNKYEWTYCENYLGVSTSWDPQLTLFDNSNTTIPICYSADAGGTCGLAPYISWTATFTGVVRLLTTAFVSGVGTCLSNSGATNKLAYRQIAGTSCIYSISPSSVSPSSSSGSGSVSVTATAGCSWTAISNNSSWLTVTSGGSGSGNGTVNYTYTSNTSSVSRTGTITIAGKTFTVSQAGTVSCSYSISPASVAPTSSSGSGSVSVTATSGCSWTAISNNTSWLTITSGSSGTGNGIVNYSYTSNSTASSRIGTITISDKTFTVTQAGANNNSLLGVDVSHWNGTINWSQVYSAGKSFAYIKATEGVTTNDAFFEPSMTSSNPNKVVLGGYHLARPDFSNNNTAINEASHFLTIAGAYIGAGYLPPALDIEGPVVTAYLTNHNISQLAIWINDWCNQIHSQTNIWPVLYGDRCNAAGPLYPYYQNGVINANIKLWIADYSHTAGSPGNSSTCTSAPWVGWPWIFHQYFAPQNAGNNPTTYANPGMDQNIFNGDLTAFNNLISVTSSCSDQYESNNTVSTATLVFAQPVTNSSNYITQGNIGFVGDDDWYKINIGACGTVTVNLSNLPADYDVELWDKYSSNGGIGTVLSGSYNTNTSNETVSFSYQGSNTAYIKIYAKNHQSFTTNSCYSIQFIFTPCAGGPPPNDVCSNATLLPVNSTCIPLTNQYLTNANSENRGTICDNSFPPTGYDVWYKFIANNSTQTITVDNGNRFYAHIAIYPDCSSARINCGDGRGIISIPLNNLTIGKTYYIQIHDDEGYAQNQPFSICVYGSSCTKPSIPGLINGNISVAIGTQNYSISPVANTTGYNWQLSGGGSITSGQTTVAVTVNWTTAGTYTLSVNGVNACGDGLPQTLSVNVSNPTAIVNPDNQFEINIIPNPSNGEFYLKAKGVVNKVIKIEVMNNVGQIVYQTEQRVLINDFSKLIDISKMANGIYHVKIIVDKKIYLRKITKIN